MDSICDSFVEMKAKPESRDGFFGSILQSHLSAVWVYETVGSAQAVSRDQGAIARGRGDNHFYLISQMGSPWSVHHAGRKETLGPGAIVLVDSREPHEFRFPGGLQNLSLQMPIDWVNRWLPDPAAMLGRAIDGDHGRGAALRAFKEALTPEVAANPGLPPTFLEDQLGALMSLAFGTEPETPRRLRKPYLRCVGVMPERLGEAGLLAEHIARDAALSLRSLHRAFAAEGPTFAGVLHGLRMAQAQRMLGDRRFARLSVAEIGQRYGYAEPSHFALRTSHFARRFRQLRRLSPSAFRQLVDQ
ncbi:MAG: helix-turn-helix domain-containing protein [Rubrivivax sp.]|nr:helix-turn-helix domain-containing protein [Rubrivivax sp.]